MLAKTIVLEGADKVGKFTQSHLLVHALNRFAPDRVSLIEVPYNDVLTYKIVYWMLRKGYAKSHPNTFQLIQFFNKLIFQYTHLLWLRFTCDYVILDRWSLSAVIYGDAGGANKVMNRVLFAALHKPTMTVVLDGAQFKRVEEIDDVYEADRIFQRTVKQGYHDWVLDHLSDHDIVDNTLGRELVHKEIMKLISERFDLV